MKKYLLSITFCILTLMHVQGLPINPMDHTSLINENDQKNKDKTTDDNSEFDADPYYILSGEADEALAQGDYVTAILRIKDALRVEPSNPANVMLLSNLGMAYSCLDQDSLAMQTYDEALSIAPSMTTIMLNRAMLKLKMGRDVDALSDFANVIEKDSVNTTARYYRGLMSLYNGKLQTAVNDFAVLEKEAPDSYETLAAMSTLYSMTGHDEMAIPYYKRLIEQDPAAEYYAALAGCYIATDQLSEASALLGKGLEEYPEDGELYYYRAWLYKKFHSNDDAQADGERAVKYGVAKAKVDNLLK